MWYNTSKKGDIMNNFEEKKQKYFDLLNNNLDLLNNLIEHNKHKKSLKILLDPQTDKELLLAEKIFLFFKDAFDLVNNSLNGNVNEIDLKNSITINMYINIIKLLKNNNLEELEKIKKYLNYDINSSDAARIIYEYIILFITNTNDVINYIASESGFNLNEDKSSDEFNYYFNEAGNITKVFNDIDLDSIDINTDKRLDKILLYLDEFHDLCKEDNYSKTIKK